MSDILKKIIVLVAAIGLVAGSFLFGKYQRTETPPDKVVIKDTVIIEKPVLVDNWYAEDMVISINDTTVIVNDSLVVIPMRYYVFQGSDYTILAHGFNVTIPKVDIRQRTEYIYNTEEVFTPKDNRLYLGGSLAYGRTLGIEGIVGYQRNLSSNIGVFIEGGYSSFFNGGIVRAGIRTELNF